MVKETISVIGIDQNYQVRVEVNDYGGLLGVDIRAYRKYRNDWAATQRGVRIPGDRVEEIVSAIKAAKVASKTISNGPTEPKNTEVIKQ